MIRSRHNATASTLLFKINPAFCSPLSQEQGLAAANTKAASVIYTASDAGQQLSASATFTDLGGGQLEVDLANTYTGDTEDQSHVLTGVFFSGAGGLTPVSATAGAGSVEWSGATSFAPESSAVLGTEWAYGTGSAPHGATQGIVSSGYYTPGHGNFATPGDSLDGSAYGILSAGYAGSDMDGLGSRDYIQPSMVFVLNGFTGSLANITDLSFQYGTSSGEPNILAVAVPEPAPIALLAVAAIILGAWRLQMRKV